MNAFLQLEQTIGEAIAQRAMPGAAMACGQHNELLFCKVWGLASLYPQPATLRADTLFDVASLTKVLATTLLIMKFCEAGRLALDTPLAELLPSFYPGDKAPLTVRQLLVHASGLPPHVPFYHEAAPEPADPQLQRQAIFARVRQTPLSYPTGTDTQYSDLGFILLGELLEQLGGQRLDQLCETHLFALLGLHDTFFVHLHDPLPKAQRAPADFAATEQCAWRGRLVRGQVHDENAYLLQGVAGHAGLFAPIADLHGLARVLLSCLAGANDFYRSATVEAFIQRQNLVPGSSRALGWDTPSTGTTCGHRFSARAFGHTGFTGTSIWIDPEQERFVVLLSNRVHPSRANVDFLRLRPQLHDLALDSMERLP